MTLLWKLLGIHLIVVGVISSIIYATIKYHAADYFQQLMEHYKIEPVDAHTMFLDIVYVSLGWAFIASLLTAAFISFFLVRLTLRPLSRLEQASQSIAAGNYHVSIEPITSAKELGRLQKAFNCMAISLQQAQQTQETLVTNVTHELGSPLTNVKGYIEALRDNVIQPSYQIFNILYEEVDRLSRLVEDLMLLAKPDAARLQLKRKKSDIKSLIEMSIALYWSRLTTHKITVEIEDWPTDTQVQVDDKRILQVISNLLHNVLQYTPPGGKLLVRSRRTKKHMIIEFANTSDFIPATELDLIFERLYRTDAVRSRDAKGTGIGLAIVREFIVAHGGEVGAEHNNGFTHIWFSLPL